MQATGEQSPTRRPAWLGPVEALIGPIGAAVVAVVLVGLCVMGWWSMRAERAVATAAGEARIASVSRMLADSTHAVLAHGDLSAARRLLVDAGEQMTFTTCRLELPDGSVLADQSPSRAKVGALPESWPAGRVGDDVDQHYENGALTIRYPIHLPGRGPVLLHIAADPGQFADADMGASQTFTVTAAVVGGVFAMLLLLWRPTLRRVEPYVMIRQALLSIGQDDQDPDALKVSGSLGAEASAWNRLVDRHGEREKMSLLDRALKSAADDDAGAGSFAQIGDALWHGVVLVNARKRIVYANGAAGVLLKLSREDMMNSEMGDVFEDPNVVTLITEVIGSEDSRRRMHEAVDEPNGRLEALRYSIRLTGNGPTRKALVVIEDVTQQRVAEQSRRDFVAQVAHELRTPLTNIGLNVEAAVDDGEKDAELRGRCLNVINQESQRLAQVVNDMLSVSEIEAGSMTLHHDDIRLDALFEDLSADFSQQAQDKLVGLKFDLPPKLPVIQGDRDKLAISLHNLLGNAIKYSPDGGEVVVSVSVEDGRLTMAFKDKGIGIDKDELDRVFDRFYRAKDSRVSAITGTGLGLPIAREIVRRHGGDIEAESELNQGSTFTVHLPYKAEAA